MIIPRLELIFGSFWRHPRSTGGEYADSSRNGIMSIITQNCVFLWRYGMEKVLSVQSRKAACMILYLLLHIWLRDRPFAHRASVQIALPTEQGGNGEEADYYDPRYSDMFFYGTRHSTIQTITANPISAKCAKHFS